MPFAALPLPARLTRPRPALLLALGVLVAGLLLSALAAIWLHRSLEAQARGRFELYAQGLQAQVLHRFAHAAGDLHVLQALFSAQPATDAAAFGRFVAAWQRTGAAGEGVRGLAFAQRVAHAGALVVRHAEPRPALQGLAGLDLAQQPALREALERTLREGTPALGSALTLPGDAWPTLLLLLPMDRTASAPRRSVPAGVLVAVLAVEPLLAGLEQGNPGQNLDFELLDGTHAQSLRLAVNRLRNPQPRFGTERVLSVGGRALHLRMASSARFDAEYAPSAPWWLAGGGTLLSVLLAFTAWLLARGRARALALAGDMTAELRRARDEALAASGAKSAFLANTSHEIRTPLNAVLGMLALLRRSGLDARQADYAAKGEAAARSLLALLDDVLDLSKVEAGKLALEPRPFRPARLFEELGTLLQVPPGKPVALRLVLEQAVPPVLVGDALRLRQVLLNLGGNAVKFTPSGEVEVALRLLEQGDATARLELSVRDTGIGIDPAQQALIFEPFTQAEASTTRRFGGTGLGLSICRRLVALMGGELRVDSAPGVGSRFHCRLDFPLPTAQQLAALAEELPSPAPLAERSLAGLRLLVAEDNATNRQVMQELLQGEGAQVALAANGREAVAAVAAGAFDAVLMDLQMPEMDGRAATARIRAMPGLQRLPVIAVSANAAPADRDACLAVGMDDHVSKPFDLRQLVAVLRRHTARGPLPTPGAAATPATPADAPAEGVAGPALLDVDGALERLNGRHDLYARLLRDTRAQFEALWPQYAALRAQGRRAEAAAALHHGRGVAGTLGASRLAEALNALEQVLQGDAAVPPSLDTELRAALADTLAEGERVAAGLEAEPAAAQAADPGVPGDASVAALEPLLRSLVALLSQSDLHALEVHAQLRPLLPAEDRQALDRALARLDLQAALAHCLCLIEDAQARP
ncbi:hybrid sensor histidine kinase/response regulator [Azohydromonas australica]|uniref:hybrid sensor histidine kinase/response regulator n=1 Tax=Azohydromonas australica TaxID=364039 RepID=UPI0003FD966F|nr:ATP-binding protein [Azohydromonas australica]